MEKREAEAATSQGVSTWIAFVFYVTEAPGLILASSSPPKLTVERMVQRERELAEAAQNVFNGQK